MPETGKHLARPGIHIAWRSNGPAAGAGNRTGLFWLGGFMSDMTGGKAEALAELAERTGRNCIRFDYSGHGASDGAFRDGTISKWLDEAVQIFQHHAPGPRIVVGSSMGGWLALLLARHLADSAPARIAGMVLIAPAADMTRDLMWNRYDEALRRTIETRGYHEAPSDYGPDPYIITRDLIEDGKRYLLLDDRIKVTFPVRILQGEDDPDVPWQHAHRLYDALTGPDITFTLIKSGDHRLSTPRDIETLRQACLDLCRRHDGDS